MEMKISMSWSALLLVVACGGSDPVADQEGGTTGAPEGSSGGANCEAQPTVIVGLRSADGQPVQKAVSYTIDGQPGTMVTCMLGACVIWDGAGQTIRVEADDGDCVVTLSTLGGGASTCEAPSAMLELVFGECGDYDGTGFSSADSSGGSGSESGTDGATTGTGTTSDEATGSESTGSESTGG